MALEKKLDQETKDVLTESHFASKSLIYVIDDLLHSTGSAYQPPLPMVHINFDLRKIVETTLDQLQKHATQKRLSFSVYQDDDVPTHVFSDLQRFQQAVTQLVINAIEHTQTGGVAIHLTARPTTEGYCVVHILVQDTGIGMSERDLDELFQELEQVPDEDIGSREISAHGTQKQAKLGLGLALVARYIKQCGGQVRGKSVQFAGSTFSLDIPMQIGKEDTLASLVSSATSSVFPEDRSRGRSLGSIARPTTDSPISSGTSPNFQLHIDRPGRNSEQSPSHVDPRQEHILAIRSASPNVRPMSPVKEKPAVLIADDNSVNLSILKRRLERMGHEVKTSVDGQQCFEVYQEHQRATHFILMDINVCNVLPLFLSYLLTMTRRCRSSMAFNPRE
jgi:two-component sensor histidine kinase